MYVSASARGAVGGEAVVDRHHALVRDHVARDAAGDRDRVQPLVVLEAVDVRPPRHPVAQDLQDRGRLVDRVPPHPRPGGVRPRARRRDRGPQGALAAALDHPAAGLEQHRELAVEELGGVAGEQEQAVALGRDLLALVEHVGHVAGRRVQGRGETELDRHPGLHVRCAYPSQPGPFDIEKRRKVGCMRHGVEMTGQHHPLFSPERGPGHERVAVPGHRQLRQAPELAFDRVREGALLAADGGDVGQRGGQRGAVEVQVEVVVHGCQPIVRLTRPWPARPPRPPPGGSSRARRRAAR